MNWIKYNDKIEVEPELGEIKTNYKINLINNHLRVSNNKCLHQIIWEVVHGEYDTNKYVVHHINHNPLDNRIDNLQLMTKTEHVKHHHIGIKHPYKERPCLQNQQHSKEWKDNISKGLINYYRSIGVKEKGIYQYEKKKLVKIWKSFDELKESGFNIKFIKSCIDGKMKTYFNYVWKQIK